MTRKISLEEAKKLATPKPLEVRVGTAGHACLYVQGTMFNVAVGMKPADAFLFKHLRNTHDELVEELEGVLEWLKTGEVDGVGYNDAVATLSVEAVLAKARTVEMP